MLGEMGERVAVLQPWRGTQRDPEWDPVPLGTRPCFSTWSRAAEHAVQKVSASHGLLRAGCRTFVHGGFFSSDVSGCCYFDVEEFFFFF